ncbi:hypothetical protein H6G36_18040 [Anabaena minutissima FACHB-250]|nr:hypothetical protein [Anabaena minutissima FACHB-250]
MNSFSFFNASSYNALSASSNNNNLFPSKVVVPTFSNEPLPNLVSPVLVFSQFSQQRF